MSKDDQKKLDEAIFELNYEPDSHYHLIQPEPPLSNRQFLINSCIGLGIYIGIPLAIAFGFWLFNR
jgi:hypothetical protein